MSSIDQSEASISPEVALVAGPLAVAVQGVSRQQVPRLTRLARHGGHEGAQLCRVNTPGIHGVSRNDFLYNKLIPIPDQQND